MFNKETLHMKVYGCIYKIINLMNNKCYIGQTTNKDPEKYILSHFQNAKRNQDNRHFYNALRKYGKKNFKWIVLGFCFSKQELDEAEKTCIDFFSSRKSVYGYNIGVGGEGGDNLSHHPNKNETIKKRTETLKLMYLNKPDLRSAMSVRVKERYKNNDYRVKWIQACRNSCTLEKINKCKDTAKKNRYKNSVKQKMVWNNKSLDKKVEFVNKMIEINNFPEHKSKSVNTRKKRSYKIKISSSIKKYIKNNPESRLQKSINCKEQWNNNVIRLKRIEGVKKSYQNPDLLKRKSEALKSEKRKEIDKTIINFILNTKFFTVYDIISFYNCSYDLVLYLIKYLLKEDMIFKFERKNGNRAWIYCINEEKFEKIC